MSIASIQAKAIRTSLSNMTNMNMNITNVHAPHGRSLHEPSHGRNLHEHGKMLHVGFLLPLKKIAKMQTMLDETLDNIIFIPIQLSMFTSHTVPHMDLFLHKLTHELTFATFGLSTSHDLEAVTLYFDTHPEITIIDEIEKAGALIDRSNMYTSLQTLATSTHLFHVPKFIVLGGLIKPPSIFNLMKQSMSTSIQDHDMHFPLICKTIPASATYHSHKMLVVGQDVNLEMELKALQPSSHEIGNNASHENDVHASSPHGHEKVFPILLQEYKDHDGIFYKCYRIGSSSHIATRLSLPNLHHMSTDRSVFFDTQKPFPSYEAFDLQEPSLPHNDHSALLPPSAKVQQTIIAIGDLLERNFGLTLFGFDVIIEKGTKKVFVVDINYFPSYNEVDDFNELLRTHLHDVYDKSHTK